LRNSYYWSEDADLIREIEENYYATRSLNHDEEKEEGGER